MVIQAPKITLWSLFASDTKIKMWNKWKREINLWVHCKTCDAQYTTNHIVQYSTVHMLSRIKHHITGERWEKETYIIHNNIHNKCSSFLTGALILEQDGERKKVTFRRIHCWCIDSRSFSHIQLHRQGYYRMVTVHQPFITKMNAHLRMHWCKYTHALVYRVLICSQVHVWQTACACLNAWPLQWEVWGCVML